MPSPQTPLAPSLLPAFTRSGGVAALVSLLGCGASINAVYEGDVRFEHCMALNTRPDVGAPQRRACWDEWLTFYTFGQTRDRIEHAARRREGLAKSEPPKAAASTVEPVAPMSALVPPPRLLAVKPTASAVSNANAMCAFRCDDAARVCARACADLACAGQCESQSARCLTGCATPR